MFWEWCGLFVLIGVFCARGNWSEPSSVPPVAACWSIKPVCTPPWPSVRPVRPPRALTVDKSWVWPVFDACVGVCRVSGVHGLNVPLPLCPPSRSFLPWGLLTEHGSTAAATTVFRWSSRRPRRSGKWNPSVECSRAPATPLSRVPGTPGSFYLCSFHLGATTTTTTTTIVTTPRRQATAGNHFFSCHPREPTGP